MLLTIWSVNAFKTFNSYRGFAEWAPRMPPNKVCSASQSCFPYIAFELLDSLPSFRPTGWKMISFTVILGTCRLEWIHIGWVYICPDGGTTTKDVASSGRDSSTQWSLWVVGKVIVSLDGWTSMPRSWIIRIFNAILKSQERHCKMLPIKPSRVWNLSMQSILSVDLDQSMRGGQVTHPSSDLVLAANIFIGSISWHTPSTPWSAMTLAHVVWGDVESIMTLEGPAWKSMRNTGFQTIPCHGEQLDVPRFDRILESFQPLLLKSQSTKFSTWGRYELQGDDESNTPQDVHPAMVIHLIV